jgi:phosphatidylserine/phosphatidylglycerophosphate/cardiolipin synthase-like enzyme
MKKILSFLILIFLSSFTFSQTENNIELVESIPVETILDNPDIRNTQEVWLEMINSAKSTIDIEQFYITNEKGEPLDTVLNAIVAAANRGVKVRIIVDSKMFKTYPDDVSWLEAQSPNIIKHVIDFGRLAGGIQHAKFFIVDDREVFLGSQNFDWRALKHIHELGVRIAHKDCIEFYRSIFNYDWCAAEEPIMGCSFSEPHWNLVSFFNHPKYGVLAIYLTYSCYSSFTSIILSMEGHGRLETHFDKDYTDIFQIIRIINQSNSEIIMQFLTYKPETKEGYWYELDSALIKAAARGVKVKLIVSDWSIGNGTIESLKRLSDISNIEVKYSAIPEYSGGYIPFARVEHLKYIVADSNCWIGSANAEKSYFYNTRNIGMVVVDNKKFSDRVRDIFYLDWNGPYTHYIKPGEDYTPREHGEK